MGNGILIREESGAIVPWEAYRGDEWEDSGIEGIRPSFPVIKIVQGTSTMPEASKHGGEFWHSDSELYTPTLEVVALVMRETRAMFQEGSNEPVCRSSDSFAPDPNQRQWGDGPQPASCAECPFSQWNGDNPPVCANSLVLLVDRGDGDLGQFRVSGKSIKPMRGFIARKCAPKRLPLYAYKLSFSTTERSGAGRKWHELNVAGALMTPTEAKPYSALLREYRQEFEATLREDGGVAADSHIEWPNDVPGDVIDHATGEIVTTAPLRERMGFVMPGMQMFREQFDAAVKSYVATEATIATLLGVFGKKTSWAELRPIAYDWCEAHQKTANELVVAAIDLALNPPQKPIDADDLPFE